MVVDTLGYLLALRVTAANEQKSAPRCAFWPKRCSMSAKNRSHWPLSIKDIPARNLDGSWAGREQLLVFHARCLASPPLGVIGRSFGWVNRFRRVARDCQKLPQTLTGLHFVVLIMLMRNNVAKLLHNATHVLE